MSVEVGAKQIDRRCRDRISRNGLAPSGSEYDERHNEPVAEHESPRVKEVARYLQAFAGATAIVGLEL